MSASVGIQTLWGALRDTPRRRFGWLIAISLLVHALVMTPLGTLFGLLALLSQPEEGPVETLRGIPVDLFEEEQPAKPEPPEPELPDEPKEPVAPAIEPPSEVAAKRSLPQPKEKDSPKSTPDAGARQPADAGAKPLAEKPSKPKPIADPVALSGTTSKVVDANANVRLTIITKNIRKHPVAPRMAQILRTLPQWRSFFGSNKVDPVNDFDRVVVVGPQFRKSAEVVALLEYNTSPANMRAAIQALVSRKPKGDWLKWPFPAARAHADRADRIFALPAKRLLLVSPLELQDQVKSTRWNSLKPYKGDEAAVVHIKTPWRSVMGLPFKIPESILWMRLRLTPSDDGGVLVEAEAEDASPKDALEHTDYLRRQIDGFTQSFWVRLIVQVPPVELRSQGKMLRGSLKVPANQLDKVLNFVEGQIQEATGERLPRLTGDVSQRKPAHNAGKQPPPSAKPARKAPQLTPPQKTLGAGRGVHATPSR